MPFKLGPLELFLLLIIVGVIVVIVKAGNKGRQKEEFPTVCHTNGIQTPVTKSNLIQRINTYFGSSNYTIFSQSENNVVLQGGKDIDGCLFVVLLLLLLVGALIYWVMAKSHQIVVNWENGDGFLTVTATGNSRKAQIAAMNFLNSLPISTEPVVPNPPNIIQTPDSCTFCHKCGNKVTVGIDYCPKCGTKIVR